MMQKISKIVCYMSIVCFMLASNALDKIANLDGEKAANPAKDPASDKPKHDSPKNIKNKPETKNDAQKEQKTSSSQPDNKEKKMDEPIEKENVVSNTAVNDEHAQQDDSKVEITPVLVVEDDDVAQPKEKSPSAQNIAAGTNQTTGAAAAKKILTKEGTDKTTTDKGMLSNAKDSVMNATQGIMSFAQQKCGKVSASLEHAKNSTKDMTGWAKISNFVKAWWEHFQK